MDGALGQTALFFVSLILMMGIVVVIHELGHYYAGRWFGAAVESFSVGFGRPITERKDKRGTRWRINWIPLGGFVKFVGEAQGPRDVGRVEQGPEGKPYSDLSPLQRIVVSLAGPAANFVLAVLIFSVMLLWLGSPRETIRVEGVVADGPAAQAGLEPGDVLISVDGKTVENRDDLLLPVKLQAGSDISVTLDRAGETLALTLTPERKLMDNGLGQMVPLGSISMEFSAVPLEPKRYGPIGAVTGGVVETVETVDMTVDMLVRMVTGKEPLSNLSGPVGIGDVTRRVVNRTLEVEEASAAEKARALAIMALKICALVSVGIGLFNLLPFPILDGGHVVFYTWEAVTGRALPEKIQEGALTVGFFLLIGLFVVVTWGDILETGVFTATGSE
ncbi:MAG: M50 family metallopeptidase [Hyphomonadaceae bacterium]|nr:M50 family metallopeptidase [Hyphomonadaceae bacterium]